MASGNKDGARVQRRGFAGGTSGGRLHNAPLANRARVPADDARDPAHDMICPSAGQF